MGTQTSSFRKRRFIQLSCEFAHATAARIHDSQPLGSRFNAPCGQGHRPPSLTGTGRFACSSRCGSFGRWWDALGLQTGMGPWSRTLAQGVGHPQPLRRIFLRFSSIRRFAPLIRFWRTRIVTVRPTLAERLPPGFLALPCASLLPSILENGAVPIAMTAEWGLHLKRSSRIT